MWDWWNNIVNFFTGNNNDSQEETWQPSEQVYSGYSQDSAPAFSENNYQDTRTEGEKQRDEQINNISNFFENWKKNFKGYKSYNYTTPAISEEEKEKIDENKNKIENDENIYGTGTPNQRTNLGATSPTSGQGENIFPSGREHLPGNYGEKENTSPKAKEQPADEKYWDIANVQAVNNAFGEFTPEQQENIFKNKEGNRNDKNNINWDYINNETNFWKDKDIKQAYADRGVTYDTVMNQLTPGEQTYINNANALARTQASGRLDDWMTRDTASETPGFTALDQAEYAGAIGGLDKINDQNAKAILEKQRVWKRGNDGEYYQTDQLHGQDYMQMMKDYDPKTNKVYTAGEAGRYGQNLDLGDYTTQATTNPMDLSKQILEDPSQIYNYSGGNMYDVNDVTDKMANAGISLKFPDGTINDLSSTYVKKWLDDHVKDENQNNVLQKALRNERDRMQGQLNSVILADALAKGTSGLEQTENNQDLNEARINTVNDFLNWYAPEGNELGYNFGNFGYGDKQILPYDTNIMTTLTGDSSFDPSNPTELKKSDTGFLDQNQLAAALARAGIRRI